MSEAVKFALREQLEGLEPGVPNYDYEGLSLPQGIVIDAVFGAHRDVGQIEDTRVLLRSYDIVVQESLGTSESTLKLLQKVAKGDYRARERMLATIALSSDGPSNEEDTSLSIKTLYDIRKPLLIIDPPAGHRIAEKTLAKFSEGVMHVTDFDRAVKNQKAKLVAESQTNLDRENYMLRSFCEQITDMVTSNPRLAKARESGNPVRVVLFNFGLTHAGLFEGLKEVAKRSGFELEGTMRMVMDDGIALYTAAQAYTRHVYGYEIDDDMAARGVVESVLTDTKVHENPGLSLMVATSESVGEVERKTMDELRGIFNGIVWAPRS